jgi:DNA-binding NarL/FixJ family response regulator
MVSGGGAHGHNDGVGETAVAVVDHQPVLCESFSAFLSDQPGIRVVGSASTAAESGDLIATRRPDVLILDSEFASIHGVDVLGKLRTVPSRPGVVMLMANESVGFMSRALRMGVSGLVLRAAPMRDLMEAIHWVAKGQMWVSPPLLTSLLQKRPETGSSDTRCRLQSLTKREFEVLNLLVEGLNQREISSRLFVSANTVRTHNQNLQKKLGVHSAVAAVLVALDAGVRPEA